MQALPQAGGEGAEGVWGGHGDSGCLHLLLSPFPVAPLTPWGGQPSCESWALAKAGSEGALGGKGCTQDVPWREESSVGICLALT